MTQKINSKNIPKLICDGGNMVTMHFGMIERWISSNIQECELQLNPDFQRGHVWEENQQIEYVEYLLRGGIDNKTIRFNHPSWTSNSLGEYQDFVIVDGLQRLTAVRKFLSNELCVFGNFKLDDFSDKTRLLRRYYLNFTINSLKRRRDVLQWYLQINHLGTPHTSKEIQRVQKLLEVEN